METMQLLIVGAVFIISIVLFWRRTSYALPAPALQRVKVRDPVLARRMLFDHADAFSDRGLSTFPVDFNAGVCLKRYGINTVRYGPLWRALTCNFSAGIFHPSRLGRLAPLQQEAVEALVAGLSSHGAGEVVAVRDSLYNAMFPLTVRLCFGDGVDAHYVRTLYNAMQEFFREVVAARALAASRLARVLQWNRWLRFASTFNRMIDLFAPLIEARRRRSKRDNISCGICYVDSLLELQVPDDDHNSGSKAVHNRRRQRQRRALRDDEISALAWEFLGAGTWPVVTNMEWMLAQLVTHPGVQTKLYHEVAGDSALTQQRLRGFPYLRAVMLETLRLHPSVPFIIRDTAGTDAAKVCGATALAGCPLVNFTVSARDVGRNADAWTHPNEFIPERFLPGGEGEHVSPIPGSKEIKMIPFGAGRRACPGAGMAMLHVKMVIARLVREFEWAPPDHGGSGVDLTSAKPLRDGGSGVDLTSATGFFNVMKTPLRARITPRSSK